MAKHAFADHGGDLRKYFAAIPNIVLSMGLNPYELALYCHFKKTAGDDGGVCWKSRATIAKESGMSSGMVTKARQTLEQPRVELNNLPLITVREEPSKSGGNPTCAVSITDIWLINMTYCTPSLHDVARSYSDVEPKAPSSHAERGHTVTRARSPHVLKEKPLKKNPKEPSAHAELMAFHDGFLDGPVPDGGAQGKAIKSLLESYSAEECKAYYTHLRGETWRTAPVTWLTVKRGIGDWLARGRTSSTQSNGSNHKPKVEYDPLTGQEWVPKPFTAEDAVRLSPGKNPDDVRAQFEGKITWEEVRSI